MLLIFVDFIFPFRFQDGLCDLIVLVPDHCPFFYCFNKSYNTASIYLRSRSNNVSFTSIWPRGYKFVFMHKSVELEILNAH